MFACVRNLVFVHVYESECVLKSVCACVYFCVCVRTCHCMFVSVSVILCAYEFACWSSDVEKERVHESHGVVHLL